MTERISKSELARIMAPLTILPGADKMTSGHWDAYHAVLKHFYSIELSKVVSEMFRTSKWWPMPEAILTRLHSRRKSLGPNYEERLEVLAAGGPDPGPMVLLTEAERADIVASIPGAARIGHAKSSENRQQPERNR